MLARTLLLISALAAAGCTGPRIVMLRPQHPPTPAGQSPTPLHILTSTDGTADPLPLAGGGLAFESLVPTLGDVIGEAASGWATRHAAERPGGWELKVELLESHADASGGLETVELVTRVTLTGTLGKVYRAQTRGYCKQTNPVNEADPAATVYRCLDALAHDLAGWLEAVPP